jgi:hypothetical protein
MENKKSQRMIENAEWVVRTIKSCVNIQQFEAAKRLSELFRVLLAVDEVPEEEIRKCEDDINWAIIEKETELIIY